MPDFTSLNAVLSWLSAPAGIAAFFVFVSDVFRNWAEEGKLDKFSPLGLNVAVAAASTLPPVAAYLILTFLPAETLAAIEPYYSFVASLAIAFLGQKLYFRFKS